MTANIREWDIMKTEKIEKLKSAGFEVGDAADFLELTPEEVEKVGAREKREIAFGGAKIKHRESV